MEKYVLLIVLALCGSVVPEAAESEKTEKQNISPYVFEDLVNSTIQTLLAQLDPISLEGSLLNLELPENALVNGKIALADVTVKGLSETLIPSLNVALIGLKVNFSAVVPTLEIDAGYDADLELLSIPRISGIGSASIKISGVKLTGYLQPNISLSPIQLTDFIIELGVESVEVKFDDLLYTVCSSSTKIDALGSSLITGIANNLIVAYLNENAQTISETISPILKLALNVLLTLLLGGDGSEANSEAARLISDLNQALIETMPQN